VQGEVFTWLRGAVWYCLEGGQHWQKKFIRKKTRSRRKSRVIKRAEWAADLQLEKRAEGEPNSETEKTKIRSLQCRVDLKSEKKGKIRNRKRGSKKAKQRLEEERDRGAATERKSSGQVWQK
jgi:hypothetical protein